MEQEELVHTALQQYQDEEVGMRGAARIAGLTISEMMHEANERDVPSNYDHTNLERDRKALK